jgi:hypothetical protein
MGSITKAIKKCFTPKSYAELRFAELAFAFSYSTALGLFKLYCHLSALGFNHNYRASDYHNRKTANWKVQ